MNFPNISMIKNIILDLAGVVLNLNLERDTKALNDIGLPDFDECLRRQELRIPLLDYLNGLTSEHDFLNHIRPFCSQSSTNNDILDAMDAVLDDIPKSRLQLIISLRKDYRVFLLSNIYEKAWQYAVERIEEQNHTVEECFEKAFLSYEMMMAKPDPRIFHAVIEATGIIPEETLFLDDTRSNVDVANNLGFNAVLVEMNKLEDCLSDVKQKLLIKQ